VLRRRQGGGLRQSPEAVYEISSDFPGKMIWKDGWRTLMDADQPHLHIVIMVFGHGARKKNTYNKYSNYKLYDKIKLYFCFGDYGVVSGIYRTAWVR
jgi:hypothetical protein